MVIAKNTILTKSDEVSTLFCPTGRNVDPEALICLKCDLPECDGEEECPRYQREMKKLQEAGYVKSNT